MEDGKDDLLSPAERHAIKRLENGQKKVVRFESAKSSSSEEVFEKEVPPDEEPQEGAARRSSISLGGSTKKLMASPAAALKSGMSMAHRGLKHFGSSMALRVSRTFLSDDYVILGKWWKFNEILDPRSPVVRNWQLLFVTSCMVGTFVDPLFFYLPYVRVEAGQSLLCIDNQKSLAVVVTVLRTFVDCFTLIHIFMQFRIAYIARTTRMFGRGELVVDPKMIRNRYMSKMFWLDILTVLPLPQVTLWGVIPRLEGAPSAKTKNAIRYLILIQFFPRLFRIFPLVAEMQRHSGIIMTTAWAGAFLNVLLYMLTSHVIGAVYYLLAVERTDHCWRKACRGQNNTVCTLSDLQCRNTFDVYNRTQWAQNTNISLLCDPTNSNSTLEFDYGIYQGAIEHVVSTHSVFFQRYFWTLWWALQTLSSLGQNLNPSVYLGEILFCIFIGILGLTILALLIGNIQTYLSSLTMRLEEMRLKRRDTEKWMQHRNMPSELRERVRDYNQFVWVATNGVDEEYLMAEWPADLRRDIKRHLCLDLVRKVPLFADMDDTLLDAICDRLRPALFTEGTLIFREDDPVPCMYFIIRGRLDSLTTHGGYAGGRSGYFNMGTLGPGSFCGDELLTWALDPNPKEMLPTCSRMIQASTEVEAFRLLAGDLKDVAAQYRRLHSRHLQHVFRFHSHHWRTWAACCIQAAWRRYWRRKCRRLAEEEEDMYVYNSPTHSPGRWAGELPPWQSQQLRKPSEPDFAKFGFGNPSEEKEEEEDEDAYGNYSPSRATPHIGNTRQRQRFTTTQSGPLNARGNPVRASTRGHVMQSGPLDSTGGPQRRQRWAGAGQDDDEPSHIGFTGPL